MQVLLVEFRIHTSFVPAFEAAIADNARASREEPGCRQFDVCRDPADGSRFVLYELYDDQAAIDAHLRSAHYLSMDSVTRDWIASKTVRRLTLAAP
jgi:(4S)-4-hydroxy-5-phosphonooxypentane-2,3-dione isomerase